MTNWLIFSISIIGWLVAGSLTAIAVCAVLNLIKRHEPEEPTSKQDRDLLL